MTVFHDLTGWREEKRSLENSELWNRTFFDNPECGIERGIRTGSRAPTPVSLLLDFLETMLRDPELKAALDAEYAWQRTPLKPGEQVDVDNDPRVPREASVLLADFRTWYVMKTGACPNAMQFSWWVKDFHHRLKDEGIEDIRSDRARELMQNEPDIDFDR